MTNSQLGGCMNASYIPKSLEKDNSQCDYAYVAKPHPNQQSGFAHNGPKDQEYSFGSLQGIAAV
jgi:hypothetical protein